MRGQEFERIMFFVNFVRVSISFNVSVKSVFHGSLPETTPAIRILSLGKPNFEILSRFSLPSTKSNPIPLTGSS